jgi:FlaG/FlaF family flagellin (archaellin)
MYYLKRMFERKGEDAVSPVVGVMLMLVVTIIIAAVVSGFAGSLVGTNAQKAPTIAMDVKILNMGSWTGSGFAATVTSVSQPIQTSQLKLITSWSTTMKNNATPDLPASLAAVPNGQVFVSGNVSQNGVNNVGYLANSVFSTNKGVTVVAPFGFGPGINGTQTLGYTDSNPTQPRPQQMWGNFTLLPGTGIYATANGASSWNHIGGLNEGATGHGAPAAASGSAGYGVTTLYQYTSGTSGDWMDPVVGVLGPGWTNLRDGDTVTVKLVYTPTGATILNKQVQVTEG